VHFYRSVFTSVVRAVVRAQSWMLDTKPVLSMLSTLLQVQVHWDPDILRKSRWFLQIVCTLSRALPLLPTEAQPLCRDILILIMLCLQSMLRSDALSLLLDKQLAVLSQVMCSTVALVCGELKDTKLQMRKFRIDFSFVCMCHFYHSPWMRVSRIMPQITMDILQYIYYFQIPVKSALFRKYMLLLAVVCDTHLLYHEMLTAVHEYTGCLVHCSYANVPAGVPSFQQYNEHQLLIDQILVSSQFLHVIHAQYTRTESTTGTVALDSLVDKTLYVLVALARVRKVACAQESFDDPTRTLLQFLDLHPLYGAAEHVVQAHFRCEHIESTAFACSLTERTHAVSSVVEACVLELIQELNIDPHVDCIQRHHADPVAASPQYTLADTLVPGVVHMDSVDSMV